MIVEDEGKILYEDNSRRIIKVQYPDGSRAYKFKEMRKTCFACNKTVHRESGKRCMTKLIRVLITPKFLCHSCYVATVKLVKHMAKTEKKSNDFKYIEE